MQTIRAAVVVSMLFTMPAFAEGGACKFSNIDNLNKHLTAHVTYPVKGKDLKEACRKEMPDEFSKDERACIDSKIKDNAEYKTSKDVLAALGVKK
jgi:hypothetical protein